MDTKGTQVIIRWILCYVCELNLISLPHFRSHHLYKFTDIAANDKKVHVRKRQKMSKELLCSNSYSCSASRRMLQDQSDCILCTGMKRNNNTARNNFLVSTLHLSYVKHGEKNSHEWIWIWHVHFLRKNNERRNYRVKLKLTIIIIKAIIVLGLIRAGAEEAIQIGRLYVNVSFHIHIMDG